MNTRIEQLAKTITVLIRELVETVCNDPDWVNKSLIEGRIEEKVNDCVEGFFDCYE